MKYLLLALTLCFGCTVSDSKAKEVLRSAGYTNIEIGEHAWFACSEGDEFASKFTATNANGQRVSGAVCCGILKNCTIRF